MKFLMLVGTKRCHLGTNLVTKQHLKTGKDRSRQVRIGKGWSFWYSQSLQAIYEKGSGKKQNIDFVTYVRPVHFQGRARNWQFYC